MDLIFLNGPSSSGKTSLARQLQDRLDENFLYFGIDAFMEMMPARSNDVSSSRVSEGFYWKQVMLPNHEPGQLVVSGDYGRQVEAAFRVAIQALLKTENRLIVDNVVDGNGEMTIFRELLSEFDCCYVGVFCSLEKLVARERARPDRVQGSAAEQFYRTHQGIDYDIQVDTGTASIQSCADLIIQYIADSEG